MIKFKDFRDDRENYNSGVNQANIDLNTWLKENHVKIISIETINKVSGSMAITSTRFDAIRLWYTERD